MLGVFSYLLRSHAYNNPAKGNRSWQKNLVEPYYIIISTYLQES